MFAPREVEIPGQRGGAIAGAAGGIGGTIAGAVLGGMHLGGLFSRLTGSAVPHIGGRREQLLAIPGVSIERRHGEASYRLPAIPGISPALFTNTNAVILRWLRQYQRYGATVAVQPRLPGPTAPGTLEPPPPMNVPALPQIGGAFEVINRAIGYDPSTTISNEWSRAHAEEVKKAEALRKKRLADAIKKAKAEDLKRAKEIAAAQKRYEDALRRQTPRGGTRRATIITGQSPWEVPHRSGGAAHSTGSEPPQSAASSPGRLPAKVSAPSPVPKPAAAPAPAPTTVYAPPAVFSGGSPWPTPAPAAAPSIWGLAVRLAPALLPLLIPRSQQFRIGLPRSFADPLTPPAASNLTAAQPSALAYPYGAGAYPGAATATKKCCPCKPKKRGPRKPRTVCYKGSYTETASGTSKRKREQIPCT